MNYCNCVLVAAVLSLSACSVTPYRETFACSLKDDYGKCIDVPGAYQEAVTGIDSKAPTLSKKGKAVRPEGSADRRETGPVGNPARDPAGTTIEEAGDAGVPGGTDTYGAYRTAVYEEMRAMLSAPTTPMVRPARTVRTLIISYSKREDHTRLYMPRYVFSIAEEPQFVLGDYLNRRADGSPDSLISVTQDSMSEAVH